MHYSDVALRIAQISDIHCGEATFDPELMRRAVNGINALEPDVVVVAGDLTAAGYEWEFEEAAEWLDQLEAPKVVVPGNHDARNVGYLHFERIFGDRHTRYRIAFDPLRARRLRSGGMTLVAVDSSNPDLNEGHVGRERYGWISESFDEPDDIKIFVLHHHLVAVPGTGRERNTVADAGDLLATLTTLDLDVVLSGHKHVPFFWGVNGLLICNSGTCCTRRLRGLTPPSWNELRIDATTVKVYTHYGDKRRELSVILSRATRAMVRESFFLTDAFIFSNRIPGV